jgi:hypothetical protein
VDHLFRPFALALVLLATALSACGASDAISDQCVKEAERIENAAAREAAKQGCGAAKDGEVSADDAKAAARERCLEKAKEIANAAARAEAERGCDNLK